MTLAHGSAQSPAPNWRHIGAFLALTFSLTGLLDLALYAWGGLHRPGSTTWVQLQMLLPAFSAIVLGRFVFRESPLYRGQPAGRGRWFYDYCLLLTGIYVLGVLGLALAPARSALMAAAVTLPQLAAFLGLPLLIILRLAVGGKEMARVGLAGTRWRTALFFGLGIAGFYALQVALNAALGLGPAAPEPIPAPPGSSPAALVLVIGAQSVLLAPLLAIVLAFGEEYGWRGYLQSALLKWGRVRAVLLVGVIWGAWHWPLILMGFSYPGYPLLGLLLTVLFTTGLAVVLGYVVLRSGSVLLAAYLHALNDQVTGFIVALGFTPFHPVWSFGVGVFGIATLAVVALLILRNPLWRGPRRNPD